MKKGDVIVCYLNISKNTTELDFHMCANLFQDCLKYLPSVSPSSLEISIVPVEIRRKLIYGNMKKKEKKREEEKRIYEKREEETKKREVERSEEKRRESKGKKQAKRQQRREKRREGKGKGK